MNHNQNEATSKIKKRTTAWTESRKFNYFITGLILFNALLIGLETYPKVFEANRQAFLIFDYIILAIFVVEIMLKVYVERSSFFKNNWNIFDFIIVLGSLILYNTPFISVLRIFRVLRILRAITAIPSLRRVVKALFMAIPTITSVIIIMSIIFYVYAIIGTVFYSAILPEYFGNLQLTFITLFQIFTLDSWASGVFRPVFEEVVWSWLYFVSFIVIATFIMINLIVGEIVNNAQKISDEIEGETKEIKDETAEIKELKADVKELKGLLKKYIEKNE